MTNLKSSYTAADTLPIKLMLDQGVKNLLPIHVQWIPTNVCNLNCDFCSCSNRDKTLSMKLVSANAVIHDLASFCCRAVTITGGGEPLCHPSLPTMIKLFYTHGIKIGLVTNGLLLDRLDTETLSMITWCRISNGDKREFTNDYCQILLEAVERGKYVDWAFSHVVSSTPNLAEITRIVNFAHDQYFTHVRLVADLLNPSDVSMRLVKDHLHGRDTKVIYQSRNNPTPSSTCAIGYVKPVITPDFKMYHCCGVQYALEDPSLDFPHELCMGSAYELTDIYSMPRKLFRVNCTKCYYEQYNNALRPIIEGISHPEFV